MCRGPPPPPRATVNIFFNSTGDNKRDIYKNIILYLFYLYFVIHWPTCRVVFEVMSSWIALT